MTTTWFLYGGENGSKRIVTNGGCSLVTDVPSEVREYADVYGYRISGHIHDEPVRVGDIDLREEVQA